MDKNQPLLLEMFSFIKQRKNYWLIPAIILLLLIIVPASFAGQETQYKAFYKFNDANDYTGVYNLTSNTATTFTPGLIQNASNYSHASVSALQLASTTTPASPDQTNSGTMWVLLRSLPSVDTSDCNGAVNTYTVFETGNTSTNNFINVCFLRVGGVQKLGIARVKQNTAYDEAFYTWTAPLNQWFMLSWSYNVTSQNLSLYLNTTLVASRTSTGNGASGGTYTGTTYGGSFIGGAGNRGSLDGAIDAASIYPFEMNSQVLSCLYNNGAGVEAPISCGGGTNVSITAQDLYTNISLVNLTAIVNGTTYSTTNGTINLPYLTNQSYGQVNITLNASDNGGYYSRNYTQAANTSLSTSLYQSVITFFAYEKVSSALLSGANFSTNYSTNVTHYMRAQAYNVTATKPGYFNVTQSYTPTALSTASVAVTGLYSTLYNISAKDNLTNVAISNFTYNIVSQNYTWNQSGIANGTTAQIGLINGTYLVNISAPGYAPTVFNVTISAGGTINQTFGIYASNSIYVFIANGATLGSLSGTYVTVTFNGGTNQINITNTSQLFVSNLTAGGYNITLNASGYETARYTVTVGNNTFQNLYSYLMPASNATVTFTTEDFNNNVVLLDNAAITVEAYVNFSYITTSVIYTDITGRAQFDYQIGTQYRFTVTRSGYVQKQFILNPIIWDSYTILLVQNITNQNNLDYSGVSIVLSPDTYIANTSNNFSIAFSAPSGNLLTYNYTIVVSNNATTITGSGNSAIGSILTNTMPIYGVNSTQTITVYYQYILNDGTIHPFSKVYSINVGAAQPGTLMSNSGNPYGLPLMDRIVIATIIIIIAAGAGMMMAGGPQGAAIGALIAVGVIAKIGLLPLWAMAIPAFLLVMLLAWRYS